MAGYLKLLLENLFKYLSKFLVTMVFKNYCWRFWCLTAN